MKVNVIGLGYIGLPTAVMLASSGVQVVGSDCDETLVSRLRSGQPSFEEKDLGELFAQALAGGLRFEVDYEAADVYIIAVPTPYSKNDKKIDARYVTRAIQHVLDVCKKGAMIVIESTISPGTIDRLRPTIEQRGLRIGHDIHLLHAPERIIPGNMIYELRNNARTIGADDPEIGRSVQKLYATFCRGEIVVTDIRTAEMTKVVENTYRDINIAFANELAKICRSDGMDVYEIIRIANKHPRVNILSPGPGVGGHCISVDPWFLVGDYPGLANIILAARKINDSMPEFVIERIADIMQEKGMTDIRRVGLYGLTYKENVDDVRESPTLQLLECMRRHLAHGMRVYDPYVRQKLVDTQDSALDDFLSKVDLVVIMVAHDEIREHMDVLRQKYVLDTRNVCKLPGAYRL